jgi:EAL domain-containing protein (putative c-di-GMP-specific phosphodiesterase class I)
MGQKACELCAGRNAAAFDRPFTMAFQPIYDVARGEIFAHEALLRTPAGGSAWEVLSTVTEETRYSFDQQCRVKAIELASRLGMRERLSINFMPNAVYDPDTCIAKTLWAADLYDFPIESIVFEFTESEAVKDVGHLGRIIERYRARGFKTAFDDFGAGYAGLGLLSDLQPDIIKLDMKLLRGIERDRVRQNIVRTIKGLADSLDIVTIAEGIETAEECAWLRDAGLELMQGYYFARPQLEALVDPDTIRATINPARLAS